MENEIYKADLIVSLLEFLGISIQLSMYVNSIGLFFLDFVATYSIVLLLSFNI